MTKRMGYAEVGQIITGVMVVFLLGLAGYGVANLRFRVPGTATFIALTLAAAVWSVGYGFEKSQTLVDGFYAAARIEYLGLAFLPSLWLLVSLAWVDHPLARSGWLRLVAFSVTGALLIAVWTNEYHHWWYSAIVPTGHRGFARYVPGPLYYPLFGLLASSFVLSTVLLVSHQYKHRQHGSKMAILLSANAFPPVFAIAYQLGLRPGGLDPTVFSLIPAFAVLSIGLFRHEFIHIVPIAREVVVESLDNPVLVHGPDGQLVDHNTAARRLLPVVEEALRQRSDASGEVQLALSEGLRTFRYRRTSIQGVAHQIRGTVTILSDITEEKRLLDELAHQATHDALTGVANRRHFEEHALGEITRASRHGGTLALVLFDLDRFKEINDGFGHQAGDKVLKGVVAIVGARLRKYDLLARVGGEEFAVLMPEVNPVEAREAAERWRSGLEANPHVLPGGVVTVTASFGVATLNDLPLNLPADARIRLDALLGLADRSLYQAKSDGRNRVC